MPNVNQNSDDDGGKLPESEPRAGRAGKPKTLAEAHALLVAAAEQIAQVRETMDLMRASLIGRIEQLEGVLRDSEDAEGFDPKKVYTTNGISNGLHVSHHQIGEWERKGLKAMRPGTRTKYFEGSDVLRVMQSYPTPDPPPDPKKPR